MQDNKSSLQQPRQGQQEDTGQNKRKVQRCNRRTPMEKYTGCTKLVHAANPTKRKAKFLQFDICEFYPSISEELLRNSLGFAKSHTSIEQDEEDLIMA